MDRIQKETVLVQTYTNQAGGATHPLHFVGADYFCDTGSQQMAQRNILYSDNPLWDGAGCGPYVANEHACVHASTILRGSING